MPHTLRHRNRFNVQLILGFLLGIVASLLCLFFSMFLGSLLRRSMPGCIPSSRYCRARLRSGGFQKCAKSSFALGVLITSALALLLDGAYANAGFK